MSPVLFILKFQFGLFICFEHRSKHKLLVWMVCVASSGAASADVWHTRIIVLLTITL